MRHTEKNNGQALLIILLSMAVVLTVVLSIFSRSITDIAVTTSEEEALRAFSAAEAGVEQVLITGSTGNNDFGGESKFSATVNDFAQGSSSFNLPLDLSAGDTATVWFVSHGDSGSLVCDSSGGKPCFTGDTLRLCWGKVGTDPNTATTPALETSIYYATAPGDYGTIEIAREASDPNATRRTDNSFSADEGGCTIGGESYAFQKTLDLTGAGLGIPGSSYSVENGLQIARLRMIYNTDQKQSIGVDVNFPGNSILPSQGNKIESVGEAGEATRKVEVFQLFSDFPTVFESAIFSPVGITK